jgi:nucleoside-diphosphate-sugar epimerase
LSSQPIIAVIGADGFVGSGLARALNAQRIVYRPPHAGEIPVSDCAAALRQADVVVIAHGFRVRRGCSYADYRRSHTGATAALVPHIRSGALVLHISSASVLGRGVDLGNHSPPDPSAFPSPWYARAKLEADRYLEQAAAEQRFRVVFLRPAVVYSSHGAGMVDTLLKLARKRIALRLYPRHARHHLCHIDLLAEVARRVIARRDLPDPSYLVVADPYTVTNAELEEMTRPARRAGSLTVPLPLPWLSAVLRFAFRSKIPSLDLRTQGEIFGVLHMDTVYDPRETMRVLAIDPADYGPEKTLRPVVAEALRT